MSVTPDTSTLDTVEAARLPAAPPGNDHRGNRAAQAAPPAAGGALPGGLLTPAPARLRGQQRVVRLQRLGRAAHGADRRRCGRARHRSRHHDGPAADRDQLPGAPSPRPLVDAGHLAQPTAPTGAPATKRCATACARSAPCAARQRHGPHQVGCGRPNTTQGHRTQTPTTAARANRARNVIAGLRSVTKSQVKTPLVGPPRSRALVDC